MFWDEDWMDDMRRLQRDLDRLWVVPGKMLPAKEGKSVMPTEKGLAWVRTPRCDMCETEKSVITTFELPGVDKKDIELNIHSDAIEVKVERKVEKEVKGKESYSYFSSNDSFYRSVPLPKSVDPSKATAEFKNGVLKIEVPKSKEQRTKRLEIK